jgi:hypothetical protein
VNPGEALVTALLVVVLMIGAGAATLVSTAGAAGERKVNTCRMPCIVVLGPETQEDELFIDFRGSSRRRDKRASVLVDAHYRR